MELTSQRVRSPGAPLRALGLLALIALLVATAVAVYVGSQPHLPDPFGLARNGQLMYSDAGDIVARDAIDGAPRVLVGGLDTDESPLFSPLGDQFIFLRRFGDTSASIMLADADGSDVRVLAGPMTPPDAWGWAPDGRSIVIGRDGLPGLILFPTDGSPQVALDSPARHESLLFRPPDGRQILVRGLDDRGAPGLYLVRRDGSGVVRLDLPSSGDADHDFAHGFAWSDDGTQLAYVLVERRPDSGVESGLRIHLAEIDGEGGVTSDRLLEFDPAADNELNPIFVPGENDLVFQTREGPTDTLSIGSLEAPGAATRLDGISSSSDGGIGYAIDPDGKGLIAFLWNEQTAWGYDFVTHEATAVQLGENDIATRQRLAP